MMIVRAKTKLGAHIFGWEAGVSINLDTNVKLGAIV